MIIYESNTTDFTYNGKGYLNDIISANVVDTLNGDYSLTFEYPTNAKLSEYLVEGNYVKCKVADGSQQIFIITNVVKTFDTLKVNAKHVFYKLLYNFLEDVYPQNLNCQDFLRWILSHTQYNNEFTGYSNITSTYKSARYVRKNPVEAIIGDEDNSMYKLFGGELKRDNFDIYFNARIGNDEGVKLIFGKNITGININIDNTNCYTRIMPLGFDSLMLPEKYIDSDLINNYPFPRIAIYKFEDIKYDPEDPDAYHNLNEAYDALREKVQELFDAGIDKPQVNMTIDWLELSKTSQYSNYAALERVHLGDTIYANILGVDFETRVVKTTYNPLNDTIEKFEIGTIKPTIATSMNNMVRLVENVNPDSILTQAQQNATSLITQAMGGYVYKTNSELYIMDTNDPNTAEKVWRWNINGLGYSSTGINGPYGIAMTMDGSIVADFITTGTLNTNVIQGYDSLVISVTDATQQVAALSLTVAELNSKISNVLDITTSAESELGYVDLYNVNNSEPIMVQVHPNGYDLINLYPSNTLYPDNFLYPRNNAGIIRFTNVETSEVFDYTIPGSLLYLDEDTYDTFYLSYDESICQIVRKVGVNNQGQKYELATPITETYEYPYIVLTTGDEYHVELINTPTAYLFVRLMASNIYTTQFATRTELSQTADRITTEVAREYATKDEMTSTITQTADEINLEVSKKVGKDSVISSINQSAEQISINANKISLNGKTIALTSDNINISSNNFSVDKYGNVNAGNITATGGTIGNCTIDSYGNLNVPGANITGTLSANKVNGGTLSGTSININNGTFKVESNGDAYLKTGSGWLTTKNVNHPYVSGLSVASGFGGINFYSGTGPSAVVNHLGQIQCDNSTGGTMYISANKGVNIHEVKFIGGGWLRLGNLEIGENYINNKYGHGGQVAVNGSISLNCSSGYYAYVNGLYANNRILTVGGSPSTLNIKKNVKEKDISDIEDILRQIKLYDFKYIKDIEEGKKDYGYIIDYLEQIEGIDKYLKISPNDINGYEVKQVFTESLIKMLLASVVQHQKEIDLLKEEIENLKGGNE